MSSRLGTAKPAQRRQVTESARGPVPPSLQLDGPSRVDLGRVGTKGSDRSVGAGCGPTSTPTRPPFFTAEALADADRRNRAEHEAQGLPYPCPDPVRKARVSRLLFPSGWDRVPTGDEAA